MNKLLTIDEINEGHPYDLEIEKLNKCIEFYKRSESNPVNRIFKAKRGAQKRLADLYNNRLVRHNLVALHIVANQQGLMAPAFRYPIADEEYDQIHLLGSHNSRWKVRRPVCEHQYFRDLVLIDAHWVICQRLRNLKRNQRKFTYIFFDNQVFALSDLNGQIQLNQFIPLAGSPYRTGTKIKNLNLTYAEQMQCDVLVSSWNLEFKSILESADTKAEVVSRLQQAASTTYRRGKTESMSELLHQWRMIWLCGGSPSNAARFDLQSQGMEYIKSSSDFKKRVDKYIYRKNWFQKVAGLSFIIFSQARIGYGVRLHWPNRTLTDSLSQ